MYRFTWCGDFQVICSQEPSPPLAISNTSDCPGSIWTKSQPGSSLVLEHSLGLTIMSVAAREPVFVSLNFSAPSITAEVPLQFTSGRTNRRRRSCHIRYPRLTTVTAKVANPITSDEFKDSPSVGAVRTVPGSYVPKPTVGDTTDTDAGTFTAPSVRGLQDGAAVPPIAAASVNGGDAASSPKVAASPPTIL